MADSSSTGSEIPDYSSESESSSSENTRGATSSDGNTRRPLRDHKSIHVKKTGVLGVEPTVIPSTYAAFRLSVSLVD